MDAKAKAVREVLHSGDQFLVPFFQRFYSWHRSNWERLRSDLMALLEDSSRKQHFLGPLVCAALNPIPGDIHAFQLIDGQQRITTLSLALAALRDIAYDRKQDELAAEIGETYLVHRFKKGLQRFKLVPRTGDREAFAAIIDRQPLDAFASMGIVEAYHFFRKAIRQEIQERPERLREWFETIVSRIYLVVITIGEENPYEIFESLNSTGLPLEEADLIRNFVFMQLPAEEHSDFHEQHWQPYEKLFDACGDLAAISVTAFCRDFLMRNGVFSRLNATFVDFKQYYERAKHTPVSVVEELSRFAKFALAIQRGGQDCQPEVRKALAKFPMLDAATAHPLLLDLLDRLDRGAIDVAELVGCIEDIRSFVVRRTVCGDQTGGYGKWFCEAIRVLGDKPRENLQGYLLHRSWPDDAVFQERLLDFPLYRRDPKKCKLILEMLEESFRHKEMVNLNPLQIEHVMPQTISSGKAGRPWKEMLGDSWKALHERWLHTIGNLTLTGYNPNLSNRPYNEKRAELLNSKVSLNEWFESRKVWTADKITERGKSLAASICELLPRPDGVAYQPAVVSEEKANAARERRKGFWAGLLGLLEKRKSPWLPIRPSEYSTLGIPLPAYDVSLDVKLVPAKRELVIRLGFARERGKKIYAALKTDKKVLDAEFRQPPQWTDGDGPEVRATLKSASIRDSLDWLDQHEWIADRLGEIHRAFYQRLAQLHQTVKEVKPHRQLLFDYWCGFHDRLRGCNSELSGIKPLPQVWNDFALGRSNCYLSALCNTVEHRIAVHLILGGKLASSRFEQLAADKSAIEAEIGEPLEWHAPSEKKQRHVILRREGVDPSNRDEWPTQYEWLHEKLDLFQRAFQPRVRAFQSSPEEPDEGDDEPSE